jgi:hypothetical protein
MDNLPTNPPRNTARLSQAARYMVLYPIIYVMLTLPLAGGRMAAMAGHNPPTWYYCFAGSLMTSCGWLDTLLYTLTRRVFVKQDQARSGRDLYHQNAGSFAASRASSQQALSAVDRRSRQPPLPSDANWPLGTFATMTIDLGKDEESEGSGDPYMRTGTPSGALDGKSKMIVATQTTIRAASVGSEDEILADHGGIFSETTIEVERVTKDEMWEREQRSREKEREREKERGKSISQLGLR